MARTPKPIDPARHDRLLAAAAGQFAAVGYQGASLNGVLAEAGWQKSSFYHYFADKRRLHDHVVDTLATRLIGTASPPELDRLDARTFWAAMVEFLADLGRGAQEHPETRLLGEMFHRDRGMPPEGSDLGRLQRLRDDVADWLARAVLRGRELGVIRDDLPPDLEIEVTLALLQTLDYWAVRHALHTPGGPAEPVDSLQLVRDLIEVRPVGGSTSRRGDSAPGDALVQ